MGVCGNPPFGPALSFPPSVYDFSPGYLKAIYLCLPFLLGFVVAQMVKRLPTVRETWVQSLGREDLL